MFDDHSYGKGAIIYTQDQPADSFDLVIAGKVKITRVSDEGKPMLVDIYRPDEFFGESAVPEPAASIRAGNGD